MGSGLGEAQPALAPHDAGDLLDQVLLGRPLRRVLDHERCHDGLIFVGILPRQHRVARQHAVAQRIEAGDVGAAGLGGQCGSGLNQYGHLPFDDAAGTLSRTTNYRDAPARALLARTRHKSAGVR